MTRALCKGCAEIYGKRFDLHAELKKEVKKCSCDVCRKQGSCMIYTVKRKEQANAEAEKADALGGGKETRGRAEGGGHY